MADRIRLAVAGDADVLEAARRHRAYIAGETLAVDVGIGEGTAEGYAAVQALDIDGCAARIGLGRAES